MERSKDVSILGSGQIMLTLDRDKIEQKIHNTYVESLSKSRRKINGKRTFFLIDKQFIDLINHYKEKSEVGFDGMKAILLRSAIKEYKQFIEDLKPVGSNTSGINFSKIHGNSLKKVSSWHMLVKSAGTRKRISSDNDRLSMNIKVETDLARFMNMLAIEYNQMDDFKTPPMITRKPAKINASPTTNYSYSLGNDILKKFRRKTRKGRLEAIKNNEPRILYRRGRRVNVIPRSDSLYLNYDGNTWGYASFIANEALYYYFSERFMYMG